jgi:hypothetical protein
MDGRGLEPFCQARRTEREKVELAGEYLTGYKFQTI